MSRPQRIAVLGATGSIGRSTADVLERNSGEFTLSLLAAKSDWQGMHDLCRRLQPEQAVMESEAAAAQLKQALAEEKSPTAAVTVVGGERALEQVLAEQRAKIDVVVAGISGIAALPSLLAAVRLGARILLANKEALVVAGEFLLRELRAHGAEIIPLDSEHNAIFQCIGGNFQPGEPLKQVEALTLTASGGPFLNLPLKQFAAITPQQALAHPNWSMGAKISVDSATMMNKGLELIEANVLFGLASKALHVLVQPQSLLHSLVHYADGSMLAQFASPDIRVPIAATLRWPQRLQSGVAPLDLAQVGTMHFAEPDARRFPCLGLARQAMQAGGSMPAVLNAANELAVDAFLRQQIRFDQIAELVDAVLQQADCGEVPQNLEAALAVDADIRRRAERQLAEFGAKSGVSALAGRAVQ